MSRPCGPAPPPRPTAPCPATASACTPATGAGAGRRGGCSPGWAPTPPSGAGARPGLAGHSWGANVGLQFAADRPGSLAGLALVDGALLGVAEWAGATRAEARRRMAPPRFAVPLADWQ